MKKTISTIEQMNSYLKNIINILRRDKAKGPLEYIPELTWMIFLRILDEKEIKEQEEAEII
jgi:type I restriction enzyme M protein